METLRACRNFGKQQVDEQVGQATSIGPAAIRVLAAAVVGALRHRQRRVLPNRICRHDAGACRFGSQEREPVD